MDGKIVVLTYSAGIQKAKINFYSYLIPYTNVIAKTFVAKTTSKPLTVCITMNCGKFQKRWAYQTT